MSRHPTSLTKGLSLPRSLLEAATARVPGIVEHHDGDAYDKSFKSWERLVTLIYAQLSGTDSLRGIETGFNANAHHHYHFGVSAVARSTLSDANARRSCRRPSTQARENPNSSQTRWSSSVELAHERNLPKLLANGLRTRHLARPTGSHAAATAIGYHKGLRKTADATAEVYRGARERGGVAAGGAGGRPQASISAKTLRMRLAWDDARGNENEAACGRPAMQLGSIGQGGQNSETESPYAKQWRARAAREVRTHAQQMVDPVTKNLMLGAADDYGRLAQIAEAMALIRGVLASAIEEVG
jgi:hypothetical protein